MKNRSTKGRVIVIGGGLAGMTVAKELGKKGVPVVLLESRSRLGGKVGADWIDGEFKEHGFHVFPAWYRNTRALLEELGLTPRLIDVQKVHHLRRGAFPQFVEYHPPTSVSNMLRNLFFGILPWHESIALVYFALDLASQPFRERSFLDRICVNGFLRGRFYRSAGVASFQQAAVLQAQSIPSYELSAMTMQRVLRYWGWAPSPIFSMLDANLHDAFVAPFERRLSELNVEIQLGRAVVKLEVQGKRISGVELADGSRLETSDRDLFALATPAEVSARFADAGVWDAEGEEEDEELPLRLADTVHLESVPMAALHLRLKRKIPRIPREHVTLFDSRYQISFIDVSQHWPGLPNTTLSMIASAFRPLCRLSDEEAARYLVAELREYIPDIAERDIESCCLRPNVDAPLFLNTVGAWHFRPRARTRIKNLYTAGDWCRTQADLATMESAVMSGLQTAGDILQDLDLPADVGLLPLEGYTRRRLLLYRLLMLPLILPIGAWSTVRRRFWETIRQAREAAGLEGE